MGYFQPEKVNLLMYHFFMFVQLPVWVYLNDAANGDVFHPIFAINEVMTAEETTTVNKAELLEANKPFAYTPIERKQNGESL
jgi:hypothetical protein